MIMIKNLLIFTSYIKQLLIDDKFDEFINKYNDIMNFIQENFNYKGDKSLMVNKTTKEIYFNY